jgi:hypothetical protein
MFLQRQFLKNKKAKDENVSAPQLAGTECQFFIFAISCLFLIQVIACIALKQKFTKLLQYCFAWESSFLVSYMTTEFIVTW